MKQSLNNKVKKLIIPILILSVLLLCSLGVFMVQKNRASLRSMMDSKGNALVDFIDRVSADYFIIFDFHDFENYVNALASDPEIEFAAFYNAEKEPLFQNIEMPLDSSSLIIYDREIKDKQGNILGYIKLGFNKKRLSRSHHDNIMIIASSLFIILLLLSIGISLALVNKQLKQEVAVRKSAQQELKKIFKSTREIIEKAPFGIYLVNKQGEMEYVNNAMLNISGETYKQFINKNVFELPAHNGTDISEKIRETLGGNPFSVGPIEYTSYYGRKTTIRNFIGIPFEEEEEKKALIFVEDLTELEQIREKLLLAKNDWEDTFNTITDMITIHDSDFNIILANKAAEKMIGKPEANAKCFTYYHGTEHPPQGCPGRDCIERGESVIFELFEPHLNKFVEIRAMPRFDNSHQVIGLIHVIRDITEKKKNEEKINKQLSYINSLNMIDKAISSSLDLSITLNVLLEQVINQLHIDAAAVLLLNPHSHFLEYTAGKGFNTDIIKSSSLRLGKGYAGRAAFERKSFIIDDFTNLSQGMKPTSLVKAEEFKAYVGTPLISKGDVKGVLEIYHRSPLTFETEWMDFLNMLAGQAAIAIENATMVDDLHRTYDELIMAYDSTIEGWSRALDFRDKETEGHSERVTNLTLRIARAMGIRDRELIHIRRGALLHDIGKLGVPDKILLKPGKLDDEEWMIMKRHPVIAFDILSPISFLRSAIDIPYYHHEKWDGTGYPIGLKGEQIPISARIFAVVDVWDALLSDRPYRSAWPREKVIGHIRSLSGTHFDPEVVEIFLKMESQLSIA